MNAMLRWAPLALLVIVAACSFSLGEPINRSLSGLMQPAETAPRGPAYLTMANDADPTPELISALDYQNIPPFIGFTVVRESADFRFASATGFYTPPPRYVEDTRSLYLIPEQRNRYVLEYTAVDENGDRTLMATLAERRCQGDTCVLAIAESIPVGGEVQRDLRCSDDGAAGVSCDSDSPIVGAAFAAAASEVAGRMTAEDFNKFYLIYQPASE
jgi:hypothetical protein